MSILSKKFILLEMKIRQDSYHNMEDNMNQPLDNQDQEGG